MRRGLRIIGLLLGLSLVFLSADALTTAQSEEVWHEGDLIIEGDEVFTIENVTYHQRGNIIVRDNAKLIVRNATLSIETSFQGEYTLSITDKAELEMESANLHLEWGFIVTHGRSQAKFTRVRITHIQLSSYDLSTVVVEDTEVSRINLFGNSSARLVGSTAPILYLDFGGVARAELSNLRPGLYDHWDLHDQTAVEYTSLNLSLKNTYVGGWRVGVREGARVSVKDSDLHDITMILDHARGKLSKLRTGFYREWELNKEGLANVAFEIKLLNTSIREWWVLEIYGQSELDLDDSVLQLWFTDSSRISVSNSRIRYLIPAWHQGELILDEVALEGYMHIIGSDFALSGTATFDPHLNILVWQRSTVRREFPVVVKDLSGQPIPNASVKVEDPSGDSIFEGQTNAEGKTSLTILFNDGNYRDDWILAVRLPEGQRTITRSLGFLTDTPIEITAARP